MRPPCSRRRSGWTSTVRCGSSPAAATPERPAEVLASIEAHQLLTQVSDGADRVLLHGPPITIVTDAAEIRSLVSGAVLVVEAGSTRRQATRDAAQRIIRLGMPLVGLVLVGATGAEIIRSKDRPEPDRLPVGPDGGLLEPERPVPSPHSVEAERLMTIDLTPVHPVPPEPSPATDRLRIPDRGVIANHGVISLPDGDDADDEDRGAGDSGGAGDQRSPVHHQRVAGDPAGEVGSQEESGAGDVGGLSKPA